jgi:hypothetical protein
VSATTLPVIDAEFKSYADYVGRLLAGHVEPAVAAQVTAVVAGLEDALKRQARDEIDLDLRIAALEETVTRRLDELLRLLDGR